MGADDMSLGEYHGALKGRRAKVSHRRPRTWVKLGTVDLTLGRSRLRRSRNRPSNRKNLSVDPLKLGVTGSFGLIRDSNNKFLSSFGKTE